MIKKDIRAYGILLLAAVVVGVFIMFNSLSTESIHEIEVSEAGFSPSELVIQVGDTVIFKATDAIAWPASDPHPTHENLDGFDIGKVLEKGEEWEYTFASPGIWRYHDHINPTVTGKITVLNNDFSGSYKKAKDDSCDGVCFDEEVRRIVREEGIDSAYTFFQDAFESGNLPRSCHWTAHQIGEEAYELFKHGKSVPITYATSYCGYGFFHGFLETLLREDPDTERVLDFCNEVEQQLGEMGLQNCYHGIGHGFTEDPPDPRVEGDFEAMVKPGIEMCEFLFGNSLRDLSLCLSGVFTVPAGFAAENKHGLSLDKNNHFSFCQTQPYQYHKACYGEFAPKLDVITNWNIKVLPKYLERITDQHTKNLVVWVVPSVMMSRDILNNDHSEYIYGCRESFEGELRDICFGGTILGFFIHGKPEEQYKGALDFCKSPEFTEDERGLCYKEVFVQTYQRHEDDEYRTICNSVDSEYRHICISGDNSSVYKDPIFNK